jgi:GT2 family glycosyltransferase
VGLLQEDVVNGTVPFAKASHVGIVVLSYNACADTLECLKSIQRVAYRPLSTIVVDNASTDGTAERVRRDYPHVDLVCNPENLGYAGGNNVGIRCALEAGADYVLILNNDIVVGETFLEPLLMEAKANPHVGALCPKILYFDRPDTIWFAGATFDPRKGYNGRVAGYREPDGPAFRQTRTIDRACGAAMLVPRAALETAGLFDADLFLYSEDAEWSLRARSAGFRIYVVPDSKVWHKVSIASGGESSPTSLYYDTRNTLETCERHAPLGWLATWRRRLVVVGSHVVQALLSPRPAAGLRAVLQGWRDFRRRRFGPR